LQPTPLFHELDTYVADTGTGFLTLDTLADLHSGQENDRTVARQFIGLFRGLALRRECTILLLAHPSLTGMSSGSGLSGSTAWNNSVRSRLYFERIVEEKQEPDPDLRRLSNKKANYGRTGGDLLVRWSDGMFVPEGGGGGSVLDAMASSAKARRVFLELLDQYTIEGRNVNARAGMNYAPSAFAKDPRNERVSRAAFVQAMGDLFRSGAIRNESYGPPSRGTTRIVRAS
jgi:RecA-family ATPase